MRVLLAYDGSTHSEAALASICARASYLPQGTRVTAVYVLPPVVPPLARPMSRSVMSAARADLARRILAPALRALNEAGLKVRALHPTGDVATRIARVAKSEKSTLIGDGIARSQRPRRAAVRVGQQRCAGRHGDAGPAVARRTRAA